MGLAAQSSQIKSSSNRQAWALVQTHLRLHSGCRPVTSFYTQCVSTNFKVIRYLSYWPSWTTALEQRSHGMVVAIDECLAVKKSTTCIMVFYFWKHSTLLGYSCYLAWYLDGEAKANSAKSDQTAPHGAVWSGYTLFAILHSSSCI